VLAGSDSPMKRSGAPYYMRRSFEAMADGEGLTVSGTSLPRIRSFPLAAGLWCVRNATTRVRGFLLSSAFLDAAARSGWGDGMDQADVVIAFSQTLPRRLTRHRRSLLILVIDLTYADYLRTYPELARLPRHVVRRLIAEEQAAYASADIVACYSAEAAADLTDRYGIDPGKVVVCGRGLNWEGETGYVAPAIADGQPVVVGMIGADVLRKGIRETVAGIDRYRSDTGREVLLHVMGASGCDAVDRPYIRWFGRIDKAADRDRFIDFMRGVHIGMLLSQADGIPGSVYEFMYFGRPVIVSARCHIDPRDLAGRGLLVDDPGRPADVAAAIATQADALRQGRFPRPEDPALSWDRPARVLLETVRAHGGRS
jgi:glycosyltransferase involved in cell wall biosynthesis